jgi:hypothetical protein
MNAPLTRTCAREGCRNTIVAGWRGRVLYCCDECRIAATRAVATERSNECNRNRYRIRRSSGVCVQCGGVRDGSGLRCATCRERKRGYDSARAARHDLQPKADAEDPVSCARCCDLPWRRPQHRLCDCGRDYAPEQVGGREMSTAESRRERWMNW